MAQSRRKKRQLVPAGSPSTMPSGGARVPQRSWSQLASKRKTNELASSGDSSEPANRHPAPTAGSANSAVTGEEAATCSRQLVSPEGGVTYAAALAGPVAQFQPVGPLKPTAMDSDSSEPAASSETVNRRMSRDMFWPLSDKPNGTTTHALVTNACLPAAERSNTTPIFISGVRDNRAFLPGCERPVLAV